METENWNSGGGWWNVMSHERGIVGSSMWVSLADCKNHAGHGCFRSILSADR